MLNDGLTLLDGSSVQKLKVESGVTFPSAPVDGQNFRLSATSGAYAPGQYWYNASSSTWITGDISAVIAGTGLSGGGTSGDVTLSLDQTAQNTLNDARYLKQSGGTLTGPLTLSSDPVSSLHAATKQYVDAVLQGLDPKASVRAASNGNHTLSGLQTMDGVSLNAGDRVLVKNQTTGSENGIYVVSSGAWTRSTDADTSAKVTAGMYTFVEDGTVNAATGWNLITKSVTLGTTALVFTQFGAAVSYTAGTNVSINGTVISVPNSNIPYDIAGSILSKPAAGAVVTRFVAVRGFSVPAGMTGSVAKSGTAATASTVLSVQKNGSQFGSITFSAGGTTGTFAAASAMTFAAGDVLTVVAPGTQDATFTDAEFTIVASLS